MVDAEHKFSSFVVTFRKPGESYTWRPEEECDAILLEKGKLEFEIKDRTSFDYIFRSDSAFYR